MYSLHGITLTVLAGTNLVGTVPPDIFYALPDLQFILLANNPNLVGPLPKLPTALAHIMQVLDISSSNMSQACKLNSKQYGGDDAPIAVGQLTDLSQYSSCLPNCLAFDENTMSKMAYGDAFLCPVLCWNRAIPDDGSLNSSDLIIPVKPLCWSCFSMPACDGLTILYLCQAICPEACAHAQIPFNQ